MARPPVRSFVAPRSAALPQELFHSEVWCLIRVAMKEVWRDVDGWSLDPKSRQSPHLESALAPRRQPRRREGHRALPDRESGPPPAHPLETMTDASTSGDTSVHPTPRTAGAYSDSKAANPSATPAPPPRGRIPRTELRAPGPQVVRAYEQYNPIGKQPLLSARLLQVPRIRVLD